jgi:hypothetical protein
MIRVRELNNVAQFFMIEQRRRQADPVGFAENMVLRRFPHIGIDQQYPFVRLGKSDCHIRAGGAFPFARIGRSDHNDLQRLIYRRILDVRP